MWHVIAIFKQNYFLSLQKAYSDIIKEREAAEELKKSQAIRKKQEQMRAQRAANKKSLVDLDVSDNQIGVMDSLFDALKTGSAFNHNTNQKRAPRNAKGKLLFSKSKARGVHSIQGRPWKNGRNF